MAPRLLAKLEELARGADMAGSIKRLSSGEMRLRVGDWRVIYIEDEEGIVVLTLGPRGSVYD